MSGAPFQRKSETLDTWPVILCGLLISTLAVVRAPWPADPMPVSRATVAYYERMTGHPAQIQPGVAWYVRRMVDGLMVLAVAGGYVLVLLTWIADLQWAEKALLAVGLFGVGYSATMGLYVGPILACGGLMMVTVATGLRWAMRA